MFRLQQVAITALFFCNVFADQDGLEEVKDFINTYNWDVQCWGEQNVLNQRLLERRSCEYCMQLPTVPLLTSLFQQNNLVPYLNTFQPSALPTNFVQSPYLTNMLSPTLLRGKRQAYAATNKVVEFLEEVDDFTDLWDSKKRKSQTNSSHGIVILSSVQSSQQAALQTKPVCSIVTIVFAINP